MKRRLNQRAWTSWVRSVGGTAQAAALIIQKLGISTSKAAKLAHGKYPSGLPFLEQKALAELAEYEFDELFPLANPGRAKVAS